MDDGSQCPEFRHNLLLKMLSERWPFEPRHNSLGHETINDNATPPTPLNTFSNLRMNSNTNNNDDTDDKRENAVDNNSLAVKTGNDNSGTTVDLNFKQDSIFYHMNSPSASASSASSSSPHSPTQKQSQQNPPDSTMDQQPQLPSAASSKNSIFFEDFNAHSVYASASSYRPPASSSSSSHHQKQHRSNPSNDSIFMSSPLASSSNDDSPREVSNSIFSASLSSTGSFQPARRSLTLDENLNSLASGHRRTNSPLSQSIRPSDIPVEILPNCDKPTFESIQNIMNNGIKVYHVPIAKNRLGEGRFAVVYKGSYYHVNKGHESMPMLSNFEDEMSVCAVKCLHPNDVEAQNNGVMEAFILQEIQSWNDCNHARENIIKLISAGMDSKSAGSDNKSPSTSSLLLGMEYCSAGQLANYIISNYNICGRRKFIHWSKQLSSAIAFLHAGHVKESIRTAVIHLDIKPHNVLLDSRLNLKLGDFGSASLVQFPVDYQGIPVFGDGLGHGTQAYSPPEILSPPNFTYSFAADIYALGCTFYYLLTGREPFANLRNPSHQLWCIRRGFWESGANPLVPIQLRPNSAASEDMIDTYTRPSLTASLSLQPHYGNYMYHTQSGTPSPMPLPLMRFLNGETLHSDIRNDSDAYYKIVSLLKKCTAVNYKERLSAAAVLKELDKIDDVLILGTGFDISPRDKLFFSEKLTSSTAMTSNEISPASVMSAPGNIEPNIGSSGGRFDNSDTESQRSADVQVIKVPGGRRPFYL